MEKISKTGLAKFFRNHKHKEGIIVCESHNFIYMKVAKTAGTTILRGFFEKKLPNILNAKDNPKEFDTWLRKITDKDLEKYFIFTFVRNPWDRFVSAAFHFHIPFNKFIHNFEQHCKTQKIRQHTLPQYIYTHTANGRFADYIGRFEALQEDFNHICNRIGIDRETLPHKNKTVHKKYAHYYKKKEIRIVEKLYPTDIKLYNYSFPVQAYAPQSSACTKQNWHTMTAPDEE